MSTDNKNPIARLGCNIEYDDYRNQYTPIPVYEDEDLVSKLLKHLKDTPFRYAPGVFPYLKFEKSDRENYNYLYEVRTLYNHTIVQGHSFTTKMVKVPTHINEHNESCTDWIWLIQQLVKANKHPIGKEAPSWVGPKDYKNHGYYGYYSSEWNHNSASHFSIHLVREPKQKPVATATTSIQVPQALKPLLLNLTGHWKEDKPLLQNLFTNGSDLEQINILLFTTFRDCLKTPTTENITRLVRLFLTWDHLQKAEKSKT